jgi:rfaE bifunctional protein nucleotidyltransferase chain/domain
MSSPSRGRPKSAVRARRAGGPKSAGRAKSPGVPKSAGRVKRPGGPKSPAGPRGPRPGSPWKQESAAPRAFTAVSAMVQVDERRRAGQTIVFTNGVFDLLHPGHVRYLQQARQLGGALIVGVNSDRSARRNKGTGRPVTPEAERAEILSALDCVDIVVIFDEDTPHAIVAALQPDVLVKGADWTEDAIVGRDIVEARGGKVVRVEVEAGYSTSRIIEKVRNRVIG